MAERVKWGLQGGGAPTPDPQRVATIRYTIVDEPQTCAAFAEAAHDTLADLIARVHAEIRAGDLGACSSLLSQARDRIVSLDPSRLEPRRGLAGMFDSRAKRLKACRAAYASAASTADQSVAGLADQSSAFSKKHATLEDFWTRTRDAIIDIDAHIAAAGSWLASRDTTAAARPDRTGPAVLKLQSSPDPTDATPEAEPQPSLDPEPTVVPTHPLESRLDALTDLRAQAVRQLAIIRAVQNTDHGAPATLTSAGQAVETWRDHARQALGVSGKKPKKVRPDVADLTASQTTLTDRLAAAGREVQSMQDRRVELQARSPAPGRPTG